MCFYLNVGLSEEQRFLQKCAATRRRRDALILVQRQANADVFYGSVRLQPDFSPDRGGDNL